jgi:hypothetical protein
MEKKSTPPEEESEESSDSELLLPMVSFNVVVPLEEVDQATTIVKVPQLLLVCYVNAFPVV